MVWSIENSRGFESKKIKWEIVPYTRGRGLDLGCGREKTFPHFISVDNGSHASFGWNINPDISVESCEKLDMFASQSMDFVFSSHLLEHIQDTSKALKEWWRIIKPGGFLVLYLPHKEHYPNVGQPGANPDHKHDFTPDDIKQKMHEFKAWDLIENQERNEDDEYSFFQVYKKIGGERNKESWKEAKPVKTAAVIRYGAYGDLMQASSVFYGLKKQGYHVTLYSSAPGVEVVLYDPNIDVIIEQDKDQVPNHELGEFWAYTKKKYDKFINLSESVEGTLLAMPNRINHTWPHSVKNTLMDINYLSFQHALSEIPHEPAIQFYRTEDEKKWARKTKNEHQGKIVVWALAGSSVHKTWPYLDTIIARMLLEDPTIQIYLVGGPECIILEAGWDHEKRVHKTCGKWSIRQTFSFLYEADLVIGGETGVLNAAACMQMRKLVTLSHSSKNNLTRDWVNTVSLTPKNTTCFPCHTLHFGFQFCHQDKETGTAACQADISADTMWDSVKEWMDEPIIKAA